LQKINFVCGTSVTVTVTRRPPPPPIISGAHTANTVRPCRSTMYHISYVRNVMHHAMPASLGARHAIWPLGSLGNLKPSRIAPSLLGKLGYRLASPLRTLVCDTQTANLWRGKALGSRLAAVSICSVVIAQRKRLIQLGNTGVGRFRYQNCGGLASGAGESAPAPQLYSIICYYILLHKHITNRYLNSPTRSETRRNAGPIVGYLWRKTQPNHNPTNTQ